MRNFSVIFKPIGLYDFFAIMRLFLIKDSAFISLCVYIFTLPSKPVENQVIKENLSPFKINTNIYFRTLRPASSFHGLVKEIPKEIVCILVILFAIKFLGDCGFLRYNSLCSSILNYAWPLMPVIQCQDFDYFNVK